MRGASSSAASKEVHKHHSLKTLFKIIIIIISNIAGSFGCQQKIGLCPPKMEIWPKNLVHCLPSIKCRKGHQLKGRRKRMNVRRFDIFLTAVMSLRRADASIVFEATVTKLLRQNRKHRRPVELADSGNVNLTKKGWVGV